MSTFAEVLLLLLVLCAFSVNSQVYKAAILKYNEQLKNSEINEEILRQIHEASTQKIDIFIIPGSNLLSISITNSEIPDLSLETIPCSWNNKMFIKYVSCAAKKSQIYVVVNIEHSTELSLYKTSIVFDRQGKIVSKSSYNPDDYQKGIDDYTFSTDFNVTFKNLFFNDLFDSSIELQDYEHIKNFIIWTHTPPHEIGRHQTETHSVCSMHASWVYGQDFNILITGLNHFTNLETSEICNGKFEIENLYTNKAEKSKLITAILNKQWCKDDTRNSNKSKCLKLVNTSNVNELKNDYDDMHMTIENIWQYVQYKLRLFLFIIIIYVLEML